MPIIKSGNHKEQGGRVHGENEQAPDFALGGTPLSIAYFYT